MKSPNNMLPAPSLPRGFQPSLSLPGVVFTANDGTLLWPNETPHLEVATLCHTERGLRQPLARAFMQDE